MGKQNEGTEKSSLTTDEFFNNLDALLLESPISVRLGAVSEVRRVVTIKAYLNGGCQNEELALAIMGHSKAGIIRGFIEVGSLEKGIRFLEENKVSDNEIIKALLANNLEQDLVNVLDRLQWDMDRIIEVLSAEFGATAYGDKQVILNLLKITEKERLILALERVDWGDGRIQSAFEAA